MAALLALISAVLFALAATLQQRGQFVLARKGKAIQGVAGLLGLVLVPLWLLGTVILLCGYATQGVALDRGKLVVVQPLLVTTIVWALPLGYLLTNQRVTRRQVLGALVVVFGLALFVLVGDPDAGVDDTSTRNFVLASLVICAILVVLLLWVRGQPARALRAAVLGGRMLGPPLRPVGDVRQARHQRPPREHRSDGDRSGHLGALGLRCGRVPPPAALAGHGPARPALAAVSVGNPGVSVVLGILLYEERLTRPTWHVFVAVAALLAALTGATLITLANREAECRLRGMRSAEPM